MNVYKGDGGSEEEGALRVGGSDEFGDFVAEFCAEVDLFGRLLGLEVSVEGRDDMAVNLCMHRV